MRESWQRMQIKIDALSLRERAIIFGMVALILFTLINTLLLEPMSARQKQLSQNIKKDQATITTMQSQIQQATALHDIDPDKANRQLLQRLREQIGNMQSSLKDMQKGLVSPDMMSSLLEDLLKQNKGLRLVSLKTLPVTSLAEQVQVEQKRVEGALAAIKEGGGGKSKGIPVVDAVYKHDVEIVLQGGYLDMMNYLTQLEAMPWHLFWSKAKVSVDEYPKATLTLTLSTLSLDKKWLNL